jgi:hypothetical protein
MKAVLVLLFVGAVACEDARCPDNQPAFDELHAVCCPRGKVYSASRRACTVDPDVDAGTDAGPDLPDAARDAAPPSTCPSGTAWCDGRCTADPCFDPLVDVRVSHEHTCALHASGSVSCWGAGSHGALGNGGTASSPRPVPVSLIETAVEVDVGTSAAGHSCARLANGRVWCWGENGNGEVGDATTTSRLEPVQLLRDGPRRG